MGRGFAAGMRELGLSRDDVFVTTKLWPGNPAWNMPARTYDTEAQVLLRWAVQMGYPVLPKSTKPERIRQNFDLFSFALDDADMAAIATMDRGDGVAWRTGDPTRAA